MPKERNTHFISKQNTFFFVLSDVLLSVKDLIRTLQLTQVQGRQSILKGVGNLNKEIKINTKKNSWVYIQYRRGR